MFMQVAVEGFVAELGISSTNALDQILPFSDLVILSEQNEEALLI